MEKNVFDESEVWLFGYGSLLWKPNFQFTTKSLGYINGWRRRFYQASTVLSEKFDIIKRNFITRARDSFGPRNLSILNAYYFSL